MTTRAPSTSQLPKRGPAISERQPPSATSERWRASLALGGQEPALERGRLSADTDLPSLREVRGIPILDVPAFWQKLVEQREQG